MSSRQQCQQHHVLVQVPISIENSPSPPSLSSTSDEIEPAASNMDSSRQQQHRVLVQVPIANSLSSSSLRSTSSDETGHASSLASTSTDGSPMRLPSGETASSGISSISSILSVSDDEVQILSPPPEPGSRPKIKHDEGHIYIMENKKRLITYAQMIKDVIVKNLHHKIKVTKHRGAASAADMEDFMVKKLNQGTAYAIAIRPIHVEKGMVDLFILNGMSCVHEHRHIPWTMGFKIIEIVSDGLKNPAPAKADDDALPEHEAVLLKYLQRDGYEDHPPGGVVMMNPPWWKEEDSTSREVDQAVSNNSLDNGDQTPALDENPSNSEVEVGPSPPPKKTIFEDLEKITSDENESVSPMEENETYKTGISTPKCSKDSGQSDISTEMTNSLKVSENKKSDTEDGELGSSSSLESISDKDLDSYGSKQESKRGRKHRRRESDKIKIPQRRESKSDSDVEEHAQKLSERRNRFKTPTPPPPIRERERKSSGKKQDKHKVLAHHKVELRDDANLNISFKQRSGKCSKEHRRVRHRDRSSSPSSKSGSDSSDDNRPRLGRYDFDSA